MSGKTENMRSQGWDRMRVAAWTAAAVLLMLPWIAMQFTDEVVWEAGDFVIFGIMLIGAGLACELAVRKSGNHTYRTAAGVAVATAFLLLWVNGAVGIIGNEGNDANLMYFGVPGVALVGAVLGRFRPRGMALAMLAAALAQVLVAVMALVAGWGDTTSNWPRDILGATAVFALLWLSSAMLFRKAALEERARGARADNG